MYVQERKYVGLFLNQEGYRKIEIRFNVVERSLRMINSTLLLDTLVAKRNARLTGSTVFGCADS